MHPLPENPARGHDRVMRTLPGHMTLPPAVIASITGLCAIWGLGQIMIKIGNSGISPLMQAGLRSAGAAVLVALWMWRRRTPLPLQRDELPP